MRLRRTAEARPLRLYGPCEGFGIFFQEHWYKSSEGLCILLRNILIFQTHLGTHGGDIVLRRFELAMVLFLWKDIVSLGRMISSCQMKLVNKWYF